MEQDKDGRSIKIRTEDKDEVGGNRRRMEMIRMEEGSGKYGGSLG